MEIFTLVLLGLFSFYCFICYCIALYTLFKAKRNDIVQLDGVQWGVLSILAACAPFAVPIIGYEIYRNKD